MTDQVPKYVHEKPDIKCWVGLDMELTLSLLPYVPKIKNFFLVVYMFEGVELIFKCQYNWVLVNLAEIWPHILFSNSELKCKGVKLLSMASFIFFHAGLVGLQKA